MSIKSEYQEYKEAIEEKKNDFERGDEISDKLMVVALSYVEDCFYLVEDFLAPYDPPFRENFGRNWHTTWVRRNFDALVRLTEKDIKSSEYRRAFSRLVSWVLMVDGSPYVFSEIADRLRKGKVFAGNPFRPMGASDSAITKLDSIFCRALIDLGSIDDAVEVAESYPDIVSSKDLARKLEEAIAARNRTAAERLLDILTIYESGHPDLLRFKAELERLDKIYRLQESSNLDVDAIDEMSGWEFEQLIATKFEQLGFTVEITPVTGDYGADLIVTTNNDARISVQCKRFKSNVNLKAVQEVVASLSHYQCDFGVVITNSNFLNSARKLAQNNEIELWDQDRLISFLSGELEFSELRNL